MKPSKQLIDCATLGNLPYNTTRRMETKTQSGLIFNLRID
jgi:hypothetical protein